MSQCQMDGCWKNADVMVFLGGNAVRYCCYEHFKKYFLDVDKSQLKWLNPIVERVFKNE